MYTKNKHKRRIIYFLHAMKSAKPGLLLSKLIEGFLTACRARKLSEHTILDYSHTLDKFLKHVGDAPIETITPAQVSAFLASLPHSAKTVLNYHIGLCALWTWAIREEYTTKHVPRMVEKPVPKKIVIHPFSEVEIRALFNGLRQNTARDKAIILLLLDTGMRASELCGIQRANIDLVARRIKVLGKGNKERFLPFSNRTASALLRHLSYLDDHAKPFSLTRTSLLHHLVRIGKRAGVPDVHPHRFRHTFAIAFLRNGGDPYTLQEILGHSTMDMVKSYLAIAQIDIDSAHRRASPVENWKL